MPSAPAPAALADSLANARHLIDEGSVVHAELGLRSIAAAHPDCIDALLMLAELAHRRDDIDVAGQWLARAGALRPHDPAHALQLALLQAQTGALPAAAGTVAGVLARDAQLHEGWLLLGDVLEAAADSARAARARYQAVAIAQSHGLWRDAASIPPELDRAVRRAIAHFIAARREIVLSVFEQQRARFGPAAMARVERTVRGYLGDVKETPPDTRQQPKFLFFPGLPAGPYHDPFLQPWAPRLAEAFPTIRAEALAVIAADQGLEDFFGTVPSGSTERYLGGDGPRPAWDAFFFFRHGRRYDDNHARCPRTSAILEAIDLCRVKDQAPEICFSVLAPGTHLLPHHGVTNTRLVMHLPLVVPADCALNVVDAGEHHWREGELMMFDDTFAHEAWNRSPHPRVVLLMDCWNPYLAAEERAALRAIIEAISDFERFDVVEEGLCTEGAQAR